MDRSTAQFPVDNGLMAVTLFAPFKMEIEELRVNSTDGEGKAAHSPVIPTRRKLLSVVDVATIIVLAKKKLKTSVRITRLFEMNKKILFPWSDAAEGAVQPRSFYNKVFQPAMPLFFIKDVSLSLAMSCTNFESEAKENPHQRNHFSSHASSRIPPKFPEMSKGVLIVNAPMSCQNTRPGRLVRQAFASMISLSGPVPLETSAKSGEQQDSSHLSITIGQPEEQGECRNKRPDAC